MASKLTKQSVDYAKWYTDVVLKAELADYSPVKGCMVIRPNGYAIWENMQKNLDRMFKETGHRNAYFPLFIPESYFHKEAEHVEGFSPECAVVTHGGGKKLEENLMVRPTSETIIQSMYAKWINSYRDLPLLINQWANVIRWEMRTRLFLRTTEFLWQEGHTAHETSEDAVDETLKILDIYADFVENYLAVPVIKGVKTESQKFAGAVKTYCIESMMGDGKALQMGTSHFLGQNFAKAFNVRFQSREGKMEYTWQTSWGITTRMIGALVMVHGDDNGIKIPPKIDSEPVVIVPIFKKEDEKEKVLDIAYKIKDSLKDICGVIIDSREKYSPGWKFSQWELCGKALRIEIGPREVQNNEVVLARRDTGKKEKSSIDTVTGTVKQLLNDIQSSMFETAVKNREKMTHHVDNYEDFKKYTNNDGGFCVAHWDGKRETENKIQNETKATIRLIPLENPQENGKCIYSGVESKERVYFAKAY